MENKIKEIPPLIMEYNVVKLNDIEYVIGEFTSVNYHNITLMELGTKVYHTDGPIYDYIMNDYHARKTN